MMHQSLVSFLIPLLMLNKKALLFFLFLISVIALWVLYNVLSLPLKSEDSIDLSDSNYYIAHAGGGIDGYTYTNSKEALLQSLNKGYKYIELDFCLTSDKHLVCAHGASVFNRITNGEHEVIDVMPDLNSFKMRSIYGMYTPLTAQEVLEIMKDRPFILLVDCMSDPVIIDKCFSGVKDAVMIETSSISNYIGLRKKGYAALYSMGNMSVKNIVGYIICRIFSGRPIEYSTVSVNSSFKNIRLFRRLFGTKFFAFTCNSVSFMKEHVEGDIDKVYTDTLY